MIVVIAFALFFLAAVLQMLGYTGACTHGADGPFLSGVTLSSPLLMTSLALLVVSAIQTARAPTKAGYPLRCLAAIAILALALTTIYLNHDLAVDTLVAGITPCGPDHAAMDGRRFEARHVMVGIAYAVMPAFIASAAALLAWMALPSRAAR